MVHKSFRNRKNAGTNAENELIHKFWETNSWVCIRVAGSGSTKYPSPDLLASRGDKKLVLEIKIISANKKYFSKKEIKELEYFGEKFAAESWVGVKFPENQWYFIPTSELEVTKEENYSISLIDMKRRGFTFEEIIN